MGIHCGGLHRCMAEQVLEPAAIDPALQHRGRPLVAQGLAAALLAEPDLRSDSFHRR